MPSPSTLQKNRFFTEESFALVRRILRHGGIFVLTLPGSLAYYSPELKAVNSSVLLSLNAVFPYHYVVPGDTNIFMASISPDISRVTPELLFERLEAARVSTNLVTYAHLADRFQQTRRDWFLAALENVKVLSNRDFRPSGAFYEIAYENLMLTPSLKPLFAWPQRITLPAAALFVILLFCAVLLIGKRWARVSLTFAIATTGFTGMAIELMLVFGFQVVYGYVFYEIALLITAFMAGIAAGSLLIVGRLRETRPTLSLFLSIEAGLTLFTLSLMLLLSLLDTSLLSRPLVVHLLFLFLLFVSGTFIGLEFPLATGIYQSTRTLERSVGLLYAADLAGGCAGGLFTGILLFPLLGLFSTCLLLALLKTGSFTLLLLQRKRGIMI
jgi:spermidine synthase